MPRHWTLRRRLTVALTALMAAVLGVIAVVSVLAMDDFLTARLDDQLATAVVRSQGAAERATGEGEGQGQGGRHGRGPEFLLVPGQAEDTLGALVQDGAVLRAAVLDSTGTAQLLSAEQAAQLASVPADGVHRTVDLGADLGEYRLAATEGPAGTVVVTGLALGDLQGTVQRLVLVVGAVALLGLVVAAAAGTAIVRSTLRPLDRVAAAASHVAELPLERGEVALVERVPEADTDPRTEVGQVGAAFNRMLGHVESALSTREASETRVRQFVADASHELRTPLASIRGYAELTRRSPHDLPADVTHALGRVESEATRMSALVEDLLLLARLDAAPAVEPQRVDLTAVVVDALADAQAAGPDHRWVLQLPEDPVELDGDPARLHQVVANLLANARVHTPAGTTVTLALTAAAAADGRREAVLEVTDDGPGIPASQLPQVFERFARGDHARSPGSGSTGLGLAIVAAVVQAHQGHVTVESRPGRTVFTVHLPLRRPVGQAVPTRSAPDV
ncbi:sensor histidine kinase [Ornithinimicrobium sediminis]|uniref:sensor histidine kinase n=1 Tax=Ornithinimicrobium sediminis TaxID=2904603 RepID=UPI001E357985|nr:HAMP domain-containing sensor histidine kinase [Ornithinimicrobium sediminis]MCE0486774.1 HAMP domain-containing histidine kinase [Ornithinimicrobium sediminis]